MCHSIPCRGRERLAELQARVKGCSDRGPFVDPETPEFGFYVVTYIGTNQQGNDFEKRQFGCDYPNQNTYHYRNKNGSFFWSNPDGSTLYDDGKGFRQYKPPPPPLAPPTPSPSPPPSPTLNDMKPLPKRVNGSVAVKLEHDEDLMSLLKIEQDEDVKPIVKAEKDVKPAL